MGTFNQASATRTYDRGIVRVNPDGSMAVQVIIKDASGQPVDNFLLHLPVAGPITNDVGGTVAANTPNAVKTARTAFTDAIDAAIDNAAAAGKFAR
jgi:hypothetical protein